MTIYYLISLIVYDICFGAHSSTHLFKDFRTEFYVWKCCISHFIFITVYLYLKLFHNVGRWSMTESDANVSSPWWNFFVPAIFLSSVQSFFFLLVLELKKNISKEISRGIIYTVVTCVAIKIATEAKMRKKKKILQEVKRGRKQESSIRWEQSWFKDEGNITSPVINSKNGSSAFFASQLRVFMLIACKDDIYCKTKICKM